MRYLVSSDTHSNLGAFEECMEKSDGKYEQVLCLRDVVGYGPDPNGVIECVRPACGIMIRGNRDTAYASITDAPISIASPD